MFPIKECKKEKEIDWHHENCPEGAMSPLTMIKT